ncbi:hypothetical protein D9M68_998990 [compost metagenome]
MQARPCASMAKIRFLRNLGGDEVVAQSMASYWHGASSSPWLLTRPNRKRPAMRWLTMATFFFVPKSCTEL